MIIDPETCVFRRCTVMAKKEKKNQFSSFFALFCFLNCVLRMYVLVREFFRLFLVLLDTKFQRTFLNFQLSPRNFQLKFFRKKIFDDESFKNFTFSLRCTPNTRQSKIVTNLFTPKVSQSSNFDDVSFFYLPKIARFSPFADYAKKGSTSPTNRLRKSIKFHLQIAHRNFSVQQPIYNLIG